MLSNEAHDDQRSTDQPAQQQGAGQAAVDAAGEGGANGSMDADRFGITGDTMASASADGHGSAAARQIVGTASHAK